MSTTSSARTRIAPSPTGEMHVGTLRTALYCYALARQTGGQFILRVEDTDQKRYVPGSDTRLIQALKTCGLNIDEGPFFQTQRLDVYKEHCQQLIDAGHAYYCFCSEERLADMRQTQKAQKKTPRYDRLCLSLSPDEIRTKIAAGEKYVVRMKIPDNETIIHHDLVRGEVRFNTRDVDDQVLMKSNGIPTYHLAVVVDDHLMNITHVFRAEEWLPSTPKQILLHRYFGWTMPPYAHLSVFLDPSHSGKMSKRHGSVSVQGFLDEGYLPEALLNFVMLLGWNPGTNQEIISLEEFVNLFRVEQLNKKPAIFDRQKLDFFNQHYLQAKSDADFSALITPFLPDFSAAEITALVPILKTRLVKLSDASVQTKFIKTQVDYDRELLLTKGTDPNLAIDMLNQSSDLLSQTAFDFSTLQPELMSLIKKNDWHTGEFFMVFRVAIAGSQFTLPIVDCLPLLGQAETLARLQIAIAKLS